MVVVLVRCWWIVCELRSRVGLEFASCREIFGRVFVRCESSAHSVGKTINGDIWGSRVKTEDKEEERIRKNKAEVRR